jgi:hypothetical protein
MLLLIISIILLFFLWPRSQTFAGGRGAIYTPLQIATASEYRKYKIDKLPSFRDFCFPGEYAVQKQQAFVGEWMRPKGGPKEMLVFHKIGSGKTCVMIQIAEKYKKKGAPLILLPASLVPGFRAEMRSPCTDGYLSHEERALLDDPVKGPDILAAANKRIDAAYQIMSYNKFQGSWKKISAPIIIVDEVQNVNNTNGSFYKAILGWIEKHPRASVVVLSGTPLFDNPRELPGLAALLRIKTEGVPSPSQVERLFAGHVSYFKGAPDYCFPRVNFRVKRLHMSAHQAKWYVSKVAAEMTARGTRTMVELDNNFYSKSRQMSNVAFPGGLLGKAGLAALTMPLIRSHLAVYSCKIAHLVKKLLRGGLSFVYSSFNGPGGVATIVKCLRAFGYKDFFTEGPGPHRYVIWSGEQTQKEKDTIREVFNSRANDGAQQIQVVIGSPAIKEGVSLARVRRVFVMEFYWNHSRQAQIYGRASRFCSHKSLPKEDREVDIIVYASVNDRESNKKSPLYSIDLYMKAMADRKQEENEPYVAALVNCAVDKKLFELANRA